MVLGLLDEIVKSGLTPWMTEDIACKLGILVIVCLTKNQVNALSIPGQC